jgi:hypothetical protein
MGKHRKKEPGTRHLSEVVISILNLPGSQCEISLKDKSSFFACVGERCDDEVSVYLTPWGYSRPIKVALEDISNAVIRDVPMWSMYREICKKQRERRLGG